MPGIFGLCDRNQIKNLPDIMEKMALSMSHDEEMCVDRFLAEDHSLFMGRVSLGIFNPVPQPVEDLTTGCRLIFHGELYGTHCAASDPEYVLQEYLDKGDQAANALQGIFHFAVHDRRTGQLKLFSDKFGLQPLYYTFKSAGFSFAGEVKALLNNELVSRSPDYQSFADFYHFGQVLGTKTLFGDIKLLPPGSVLTYDLRDDGVSLDQYWRLDDLFVENGAYDFKASPDETVSLLIEAIRRQSANKDMLGLSLSGGLDSRGILAGLGGDACGLHTYTLGQSGCADEKLAAMMAQVSQTDHDFIELDRLYIEDFHSMALSMVRLSDGLYHPHESTEMLALSYFQRAPFRVLLRGHGGEIAKAALAYPVMVTPQIHACSCGGETLAHILAVTNLVRQDIDPDTLFTRHVSEIIKSGPETSLQESCGAVSEKLAPADVCIYYYITEHIRRQVIASLEIFRSKIEIRMPYVDELYLKSLLKLPVRERNTGEIHRKLVQRCMPELVKIPNSNTGAPLDAGPLRLFVADKFNSLMKRLGAKGYRHYTEFQKWHRTGFKDSSEKIIFDAKTADRNIYNMDQLRSIFDIHVSGKKDYGHLLGTVVGLELWFREFVD